MSHQVSEWSAGGFRAEKNPVAQPRFYGPIPRHEQNRVCPLCADVPISRQKIADSDDVRVDCRRCGTFLITRPALTGLLNIDRTKVEESLRYLSVHTRQASERGMPFRVAINDWESASDLHRRSRVRQKLEAALEFVSSRSVVAGAWVRIDHSVDAPAVRAVDAEEAEYLLRQLVAQGLLEHRAQPNPDHPGAGYADPDSLFHEYRLTVSGWDAIEPLVGAGETATAFIAMWFDRSMDLAYEAMVASVDVDCGLRAMRIDRVHHNDQITDRILAGIRLAQFTIADVTGQGQGVYFEAGYAMALGRPVIWTCRADQIGSVHFDTRQFSHVVWNNEADLRTKLTERIRATILTKTN